MKAIKPKSRLPESTILDQTKGFLDPEEGRVLYELALESASRGPCLEVGSYCGKSALYLGAACRDAGSTLFSIDHHRGSEEQQPGQPYFDAALLEPAGKRIDTFPFFRRTLEAAGLENAVVPLVCRSEVAARNWATPLGLVFIDGGHAFDTVLSDYRCWSGHIVRGGYLLMHDIFFDPRDGGQAPRQVYERAVESGRFEVLPMVNSLGILRRK
jgi:hypothetical protein